MCKFVCVLFLSHLAFIVYKVFALFQEKNREKGHFMDCCCFTFLIITSLRVFFLSTIAFAFNTKTTPVKANYLPLLQVFKQKFTLSLKLMSSSIYKKKNTLFQTGAGATRSSVPLQQNCLISLNKYLFLSKLKPSSLI